MPIPARTQTVSTPSPTLWVSFGSPRALALTCLLIDMMSAILNVRTGEAVEAALGHALEMLRLCRGDNQGVRSYVSALYLRLGRDQEAYDFINWYATVPDEKYEWYNTDLPYPDLHNQDAFEPVFENTYYYNVAFTVALTLIKTCLMKDLESLQDFLQKNEPWCVRRGQARSPRGRSHERHPSQANAKCRPQ